MNRPTMLTCALVSDMLMQHNLPASKDLEVIQDRVKSEGLSFLTLTLPSLGSALETGLERGFITREDCPSFGHNSRSMLPRFLGGLWAKIFSRDGKILPEACKDSIFAIRQIAYFQKKPKGLCTDKRNALAVRKFRQVEEELASYTRICREHDETLRRVSDILWRPMFCNIVTEDLICRHGPGATAERKSANSRFSITHWNERSQDAFPLDIHGVANFGHYEDLEKVILLSEDQELPVRVVQVPKTMKAPRTIAIEPSHVQYMQQGLMSYVVNALEKHDLTSRSIRFSDQSVNRDRARSSSLDRVRATLDLSDASDRVHLDLVKNIFQNSAVLPFLLSCRSGTALLPDSKQPLLLRKFASMGSAMCFPVEAMVFYTLIQVGLHYYHNEVPSERSVRRFSHLIDVYGDDLIVPTYSRRIVQACLEAFGLKVNRSKSFSNGSFRESCGGDYFEGYDVTPVYLRHMPPARLDLSNVHVLESLVSTSNQLYKRGLWSTCQTLRDMISKISPRKWVIPRSPFVTAGLTYLSRIFTDIHGFCIMQNSWIQRRVELSSVKTTDLCQTFSAFISKALGACPINRTGRTSPDSIMTMFSSIEPEFGTRGSRLDFSSSVKRGAFKVKRRWYNAQIGIAST